MNDKPKSRSLFHYTTAEGLTGILSTQTLYATHADFLNDSSECRTIKKVLGPMFENELRTLLPIIAARGIFSQNALGYPDFYAEGSNAIFEAFLRDTNRATPFFVTSFCEHKKGSSEYINRLLSQWRAYGKRGGFAIEIDELALDELKAKETTTYLYVATKTDSVVYSDYSSYVTLERFAGAASAMFRDLVRLRTTMDISDLAGSKPIDEYFLPFIEYAPFLKEPHFREECEYRLVATCFRASTGVATKDQKYKPIKFKARSDGSLTPYIELFQGFKERLPIHSIIIGPHPNQQGQKEAVELLLEARGISAEVRLSGIPFRE
jgi:hypothetical protein